MLGLGVGNESMAASATGSGTRAGLWCSNIGERETGDADAVLPSSRADCLPG